MTFGQFGTRSFLHAYLQRDQDYAIPLITTPPTMLPMKAFFSDVEISLSDGESNAIGIGRVD